MVISTLRKKNHRSALNGLMTGLFCWILFPDKSFLGHQVLLGLVFDLFFETLASLCFILSSLAHERKNAGDKRRFS